MSGPSLARPQKLDVQHFTLEVQNLFTKATTFIPVFRLLLVMLILSESGKKIKLQTSKKIFTFTFAFARCERNLTVYICECYSIVMSHTPTWKFGNYSGYLWLWLICFQCKEINDTKIHDTRTKIVSWKLCSSARIRESRSISWDFSSFRIFMIQLHRHLECEWTLKDSLSRYCVVSLWPNTGSIPVCVSDRFKHCGDIMIILHAACSNSSRFCSC